MDVIMKELFSTPIGLLSLFTLGFMVVMGLFLLYRLYTNAHTKE